MLKTPKITQAELAKRTGYTRQYIGFLCARTGCPFDIEFIESGGRSIPQVLMSERTKRWIANNTNNNRRSTGEVPKKSEGK